MNYFLTIIKYDYLQRIRTYTFFIMVCISLVIAYIFLPTNDAGYTTMRISHYVGYYNAAWVGYVTAVLTSVFLSLIGFYLITGVIQKDNETQVGQIIAATPISNFTYLLAKTSSNFLILFTLVATIFFMSIGLFFLYGDNSSFQILQFVLPYSIIVVPTLAFISVLAIIFELIFKKYIIVQNILFFFLFSAMLLYTPKSSLQHIFDVFGSKIVTQNLERTVREIQNDDDNEPLTIGYITSGIQPIKRFTFDGIAFPRTYLIGRLILIVFSFMVLYLASHFFHRFNVNQKFKRRKTKTRLHSQPFTQDISLTDLAVMNTNHSILPLIKAEFLMLIRKGKSWLWVFNLIGMVLLATLSIDVAHQIILPILWFLQVHRISDLTIRETTHDMHYYTFSSYLPLKRLLTSQLISAMVLMLGLALPLLLRYTVSVNFQAITGIILGGIFIVLLAAILGMLTKSKKLFEILFLLLTYANLNKFPALDYFGGLLHTNNKLYSIGIVAFLLLGFMYFIRNWQLTKGT